MTALAHALPPLVDALTAEDLAEIEDVLDAAREWAAGRMPFYEAAAIGRIPDWRGVPSEAYTRHVAYRVTPRSDPRRPTLGALMDVIIRAQGYRVTRQGVFSAAEIQAHDNGFDHTQVHPRTWR